MKTKKAAFICLPIVAIILEILPYGAVLNFGSPEGTYRKTFSYFDLTPYGYANFGPLLTAILTCVLLVLGIFFLIKPKRGLQKSIMVVSLAALLCSLAPLLMGIQTYSVVGALISAVLLIELGVSIMK